MTNRRYRILAGLTLLALASCTGGEGGAKGKKAPPRPAPGEKEVAPHRGTLFADAGHKYHAELVLRPAGNQATVYLLDNKAKNPVASPGKAVILNIADSPPVQVSLAAKPQEGDPEGSASRFEGSHDRLGKGLDLGKVEISATLQGKPYVFKPEKD
ncbi:MAG TPA: hypothetical protein VFA26_15670 [Gemmataceae bacterium]|nr:hypothetical protein [Gemmataceae bacterium]